MRSLLYLQHEDMRAVFVAPEGSPVVLEIRVAHAHLQSHASIGKVVATTG